jgi:hypothetical protein
MKMKMYRLLIIFAFLLVLQSIVFAGDTDSDRETLRGITAVHVVVDINTEIMEKGLSKTQVRTDVELRLRLAGIRVLTSEEYYVDTTHAGMLSVGIGGGTRETSPYYIYSISVELWQPALLVRNGSWVMALTYIESFDGFTNKRSTIRNVTKDAIDLFINDFLSVNPMDRGKQAEDTTEG